MKTNKVKKFVFIYILFIFILTLFSFIYAILLKNGVLSTNSNSFHNISFIIGLVLFFILGFITGIVAKKNGLMEGLLSALVIILLALLLNLLIKVEINKMFFIKGSSYILTSMAGGIIGVNLINKNNKN